MATKRANGEGTIRQRADGRWEGLYSFNGKRKSVYGKTQADVKKKLNKITHDIGDGSYIENISLTFGQWLDEWLKTYSKPVVRTLTYAGYETYIRGHIKPALGKINLQNLRPDMLRSFYNDKLNGGRLDNINGGLSAMSIKSMNNMVHAALKQAYKNGLVSRNVAELVNMPKLVKREVKVLTVQEQKDLESKCLEYRLGVGVLY